MGLLQNLTSSFGDDLRRAALFGHATLAQLERRAMSTMSWDAICRHEDFRGRWVALDQCRYEETSGRAMEGMVVDADDDLVELCNRMRESEHTNCAILFCGADGSQEPPAPPADDEDPFRHSAH